MEHHNGAPEETLLLDHHAMLLVGIQLNGDVAAPFEPLVIAGLLDENSAQASRF
ncbi:hypothetical protein ACLOJK_008971 [Asimina triloba]